MCYPIPKLFSIPSDVHIKYSESAVCYKLLLVFFCVCIAEKELIFLDVFLIQNYS